MSDAAPLLLSACLSVDYPGRAGVLRSTFLQMNAGEVLGLIGQSGSGKSTIALGILRLLELKRGRASGSVYLNGRDLMRLSDRELRSIRGREIGLVLQSPLSALNPAMRIGRQLEEAWRAHASGSREDCRRAIEDCMRSVSLPADEALLRRFPSELSVGQAQRVLIAMAIIHRPALLIADEPTSALDALTQSEVLQLFRDLNRTLGMGILYISHDLNSVSRLCDRVAILHDGEIVEIACVEDIFSHPRHQYTSRLIAACSDARTGRFSAEVKCLT
jgi:ABC-type glutathione transport system ATPase component